MARWWAILARTRRRMGKDNLSALAAGAAFQSLLSLFPTLTAVVSVYGLVADPNMVERQITAMQGVLPPGVGRGNSAMGLGHDRLHDLRLEGRQLRQDLRLAWRRHHPAALVLSDGVCNPRRRGTERGDRAPNHARPGAPLTERHRGSKPAGISLEVSRSDGLHRHALSTTSSQRSVSSIKPAAVRRPW